jgi:hypothetical protein
MKPLPPLRLVSAHAAALLALGASPGLHADILENGDMSAGGAKAAAWNQMWVGAGKLVASRDEAVFRSAPASLRLTAQDGSAKGQIAQSAPTVPGERLVASGWIKCEGADTTAQIGLQFFNANHAPVGFTQVRYVAGDTAWTEGKATATAPVGAARVSFVLLIDGDGQAWLDDAVLARSKDPAPAAPPPPPVPHSAPAQAETEVALLAGEGTLIAAIADFRRQNFTYGYEGWKDLSAVTRRGPAGLLLTGPAAGGGGVVYPSPALIDGATHLRVRYLRHEDHGAWTLHVKLLGANEVSVSVPLTGPTTREIESKLIPLPANRPGRVNQVQFQGSFSPAERFNLTLVDAAFVRID